MRLLSWNVNGIRATLKKGGIETMINQFDPDIICFQETKAHPEQVDHSYTNYHHYWNSAEKKGYSGTAVFTKHKPIDVMLGLDSPDDDKEGRVITCEFPKAFLVNVYTPNTKPDLSRLDYRFKVWDVIFLEHLKKLEKKKPVIFCGDLNVAHKEIDLARPKENEGEHGFTIEERQGFDNFLNAGFIDTFRHFSNAPHQYSWWTYRMFARKKNVGWRIDYFLVSQALRDALQGASIEPSIEGSDHCPVTLTLADSALI